MIRELTGCEARAAEEAFKASGGKPKTAIVMVLFGADRQKAEELLAAAEGRISGIPRR
jgi:N-acetylmuramic acid 6-phosphate (MurNAc-6-P) etherase